MTFATDSEHQQYTTVLVSTDSVGVFGWKTLRATVFGDEGLSETLLAASGTAVVLSV